VVSSIPQTIFLITHSSASQYWKCNLARLIAFKFHGVGVSISNQIEIGAGMAIPKSTISPTGFVSNQALPGDDGTTYPVGKPLPHEVIVPTGTVFQRH
jgi:hypothetical protein